MLEYCTFLKPVPSMASLAHMKIPIKLQRHKLTNNVLFLGLNNALKLITPIKEKYPTITWADLFQLASATAIEV